MDVGKLVVAGLGLVFGVGVAGVAGAFTIPVAPQVPQALINLAGAVGGAWLGYKM